jgi:hypothetical protein
VYVAKDYAGNIPLSHRIPPPETESSKTVLLRSITSLLFSPDGYSLFVGWEIGWYLWSVYGHLLSSSVFLDPPATPALLSKSTSGPEGYMEGIQDCCWTMSGMNLLMLSRGTRSLYSLPFAKSAATSCYNPVSFHSKKLLIL